MKTLIETLIGAAEHTMAILIVIFLLLFLSSAFFYVFWAGALEFRCMDITTGVFNSPTSSGRFVSHELGICSGGDPGDSRRSGCNEGYVCAQYDHQP
jgi:hypothetical protein